MSTTLLTCINCPLGCELTVELADDGAVAAVRGNDCNRGLAYAKAEIACPERVLTTTVRVRGAPIAMLPVKTAAAIRKEWVEKAAQALADICVDAPVMAGEVIAKDVCGTGVDVVATRSLPRGTAQTF